MSFFRHTFDAVAFPQLSESLGDCDHVVYSAPGGEQTTIDVIPRAKATELRETLNDNRLVHIWQLVIGKDQLPEIKLKATFTEADGTIWDIDMTEGRGIEADSPTFSLVHLIRRDVIVVSGRNRERV